MSGTFWGWDITCRRGCLTEACRVIQRFHGKEILFIPWRFILFYVIVCVGLGISDKKNSREDGMDETNGLFLRNSSCSEELSEFCSEPFRGWEKCREFRIVDQKYKQTRGIPFRTITRKRKQLEFLFLEQK